MRQAGFIDLLAWELERIGVLPLLWLTMLIVTMMFVWGARNAASLHAQQSASIQETEGSQARWYGDIEQRMAEYRRPAATPLKYWQDPTDVDGFSRYFLRESASKPHLPLSPLSVGESALLPYLLPVKLETLFGIEPAYEFRHPRTLALGMFDLGFAIVYVLPVAIVLLVTLVGAVERDFGILRLAASQAVTPRALLGSRLLALATWLVPGVAAALVVALAAAGVRIGSVLPELAVTLAVISAYLCFWMALAYCVLLRQRGAAASAGILISLWVVFTTIVPVSASLLAAMAVDPPRYIEYVNAIREVKDETVYGHTWNDVLRDWLEQQPGDYAKTVDPATLTYAAHLVFIAPEQERLLEPIRRRLILDSTVSSAWTRVVELMSPAVAVHRALSVMAGTDARRQKMFHESVRDYQLRLRAFVYPLVKQQIVDPRKTRCPGCEAKFVFTAYHEIPRFHFVDVPSRERLTSTLLVAGVLASITFVLIAVGTRRGAAWRVEDFA